MATIDEIRQARIKKLEKLKKQGINPYPAKVKKDYLISEVLTNFLKLEKAKKKITLSGRIRLLRPHGKICFLHFSDGSGKIQGVMTQDDLGEEKYKLFLDNFDIGDFIEIKGSLFKTKTKEKTIRALDFRIIAKSLRPLPEKWHGLQDIEERFRKRYLDILMNSDVKEVFIKRAEILRLIREYLDENGFLEVETPVLQPIYGGASARPFLTHLKALDMNLYLRISPELYLKRLIASGLDKVYEVGKNFRNEGIDRQHNPEFTAIEFYWAYADYNDLMKFTEKMLTSVIKQVCGSLQVEFEGIKLNFKTPWLRISYREMLLKHAKIDIDKVKTEEELKKAISEKKLGLDLKNIVGYGPLLDALYKEYCRPKIVQPCFLIDHPTELMPLAKRKEGDSAKIESFQLLIAGYEILKAYSELNDPEDQRKRWLEQEGLAKKGLEEHEVLDEDYIETLEYGLPPTAGWGLGLDRLTAILTNQHSLRDVILFPLMKPKDN